MKAKKELNAIYEQSDFEDFLNAYLVCALWSSTDGETPLDKNFSIEDFGGEALDRAKKDCAQFIKDNKTDLEEYSNEMHSQEYFGMEKAGHDFWLTRNGHGAGFWDRGLNDLGDRLTESCKGFGESDLYAGDDGKLYFY